jgi:hypothetical protein
MALQKCLKDRVPCAIDTFDIATLESISLKNEYANVYFLEHSGWAQSNRHWNQSVSYTVIDLDNVQAGRGSLVQNDRSACLRHRLPAIQLERGPGQITQSLVVQPDLG